MVLLQRYSCWPPSFCQSEPAVCVSVTYYRLSTQILHSRPHATGDPHPTVTASLLTKHADDVVLWRAAPASGGAVVASLSTAASDGRPFVRMKEPGASQLQADESVEHCDERHGSNEEHERRYLEGVLHLF